MVVLGRILFSALILIQLLATLMIVTSIAALTGESYMIMSGIFALILWLFVAGMSVKALWFAVGMARNQSDKLDSGLLWAKGTIVSLAILAPLTGLAFAFGAFAACGPLWVANVFHWAGLAGTIFAFVAFFTLPLIASACDVTSDRLKRHHWAWVFWPGPVFLTWGLAWLIAFLVLKGDIDGRARTAGYKLPFPGGESSWVIQGNNSGSNHSGNQQFAWDFRRRCGTPVLAARSGNIVTDPAKTRDNNTGNGTDKPNNFITIQHDGTDKTFGRYLHIQQGSIVRRSGHVNQGDVIALVGNVGNSLTGHIHFVVEDSGGTSQPVKFDDLGSDDNGIPRTFHSYTSTNRRVP